MDWMTGMNERGAEKMSIAEKYKMEPKFSSLSCISLFYNIFYNIFFFGKSNQKKMKIIFERQEKTES